MKVKVEVMSVVMKDSIEDIEKDEDEELISLRKKASELEEVARDAKRALIAEEKARELKKIEDATRLAADLEERRLLEIAELKREEAVLAQQRREDEQKDYFTGEVRQVVVKETQQRALIRTEERAAIDAFTDNFVVGMAVVASEEDQVVDAVVGEAAALVSSINRRHITVSELNQQNSQLHAILDRAQGDRRPTQY
eukprot:TRINITY_DN8323_c0_g3_i5.p2 TRINITY_DN8323_c0_g3~~TRINITY_DN8323_c0_g3_i5.p2  ORF type:complete len:197 (-),score=66.35 TRINITY_DN8323_c0_g3_i5:125-715(-)